MCLTLGSDLVSPKLANRRGWAVLECVGPAVQRARCSACSLLTTSSSRFKMSYSSSTFTPLAIDHLMATRWVVISLCTSSTWPPRATPTIKVDVYRSFQSGHRGDAQDATEARAVEHEVLDEELVGVDEVEDEKKVVLVGQGGAGQPPWCRVSPSTVAGAHNPASAVFARRPLRLVPRHRVAAMRPVGMEEDQPGDTRPRTGERS